MTSIAIGVDIGTTSTKAVAYTPMGQVLAHHAVGYPLARPEPGAAEQDPEQILQAVLEVIAACVQQSGAQPGDVLCVAFSAAMHSLILMDETGMPLTPSITWADNRAAPWAERIKREWNGDAIYRATGTPIHPMSPLAKLVWLRHERAELFARAARFVGIKEYVFFRLFGRWWVDHSIASATGLFNLRSLDWDAAALALAGVQPSQLPQLVPTTHQVAGLDAALATRLGLAADTPFVLGANDGVLSNLGVDAIAPGHLAVTIGTSGAMRSVVDRPLTDPAGRTFCYALTDRHWVVGGPVNNGGIVLRWLRDAFMPEAGVGEADPNALLMRMAEQVPAGSGGLLFHPYLAGERAPHWNADLRASYFGLGLQHRREHMVRAALEGVIFGLHSILPAVEAMVGESRTIKATGGFARSPLWRQIMADVFEREVVVPESFESSCLGAVVLGLHALRRIGSLEAVGGMVGATHRHLPDPRQVAVYRQLLPIFEALPAQLGPAYRAIAQLQQAPGATSS